MRKYTKLLLVALTASMALAMAVSAANARNISVSEKNFEAIWDEAFTGKTQLTFNAAGQVATCKITLLGSLRENTIAKVVNSDIGWINHGTVGTCREGGATILQETLPWLVSYQGFSGRLPLIERIRLLLIGTAFRITSSGGTTCLAGTTARSPAAGEIESIEGGGGAESLRANEEVTIPLGGGFLCSLAGSGTFRGVGLIRNLPADAKITITLI